MAFKKKAVVKKTKGKPAKGAAFVTGKKGAKKAPEKDFSDFEKY